MVRLRKSGIFPNQKNVVLMNQLPNPAIERTCQKPAAPVVHYHSQARPAFVTPLMANVRPLMRIPVVAIIVVLLAPLPSIASVDDEGYNEETIRVGDIPLDAPHFEEYKVSPYHGKNAIFHIAGSSRNFRTRIKAWSEVPANFAGHFILATWGCGTNCTQLVIIDAVTGRVFQPQGLSSIDATNVQQELLESGDFWHEPGSIKFRKGSRLLMLVGAPQEDASRRGISYYVWNGTKLVLVRFVKKG